MAVLKHIAIKNADYSAAVCYLKYQHDERHLKPLLDENGSMMLRSEFHMNGVNCNPDTFDLECEMLNDQYRKNYRYDEVKSHHYIISFDPRDKDEHHLTGEKAQTLGLEFVKNHLPGHQALVCTHTDGHNGSGNIHVHIIINSLRKLDIEPQSYTTRSIDCKAGYKHLVIPQSDPEIFLPTPVCREPSASGQQQITSCSVPYQPTVLGYSFAFPVPSA